MGMKDGGRDEERVGIIVEIGVSGVAGKRRLKIAKIVRDDIPDIRGKMPGIAGGHGRGGPVMPRDRHPTTDDERRWKGRKCDGDPKSTLLLPPAPAAAQPHPAWKSAGWDMGRQTEWPQKERAKT